MGDVSIIPAGNSREVLSAVVPELHRIGSRQSLWGGVKDLRQLRVRMCWVTVGVLFC
jgi:hypothetical protein